MSTQNPKVNNEAIQQKDGSKKGYSKKNWLIVCSNLKCFFGNKKANFMDTFLWIGFNCLKVAEPLQEDFNFNH